MGTHRQSAEGQLVFLFVLVTVALVLGVVGYQLWVHVLEPLQQIGGQQ